MKRTITRTVTVERSPRLMQVEGMFDVPASARSDQSWAVELPIEDRDWNIGLIVGPSGCGKSTIAKEFWPKQYCKGFTWPKGASIVDSFPDAMSIKDVTMLLSSVGFSSPPAWARPFGVLSNGEQFRVTLARALAENAELCVFDEFTSVVDRVVGRIGSAAVAKTVRRRGQKFIAVTCHDDVIKWLDPDWIYTPADASFKWRLLRGRPKIALDIRRVHRDIWPLFAPHHYLTADLSKAAVCFAAFIDDRPVAFHSYLPFVGKLSSARTALRGHRSVVLPDYQGVGIGNALITTCAGMWIGIGRRVFRNTGHPAEIASARRDPNWKMIRGPSRTNRSGALLSKRFARTRAHNRLTASFEYVGRAMPVEEAKALSAPL